MFYEYTKFVLVHFSIETLLFIVKLTWRSDTCHLQVNSFTKRDWVDITHAMCRLAPGVIERYITSSFVMYFCWIISNPLKLSKKPLKNINQSTGIGISRSADSNQSCSSMKHFEENGSVFFRLKKCKMTTWTQWNYIIIWVLVVVYKRTKANLRKQSS